MVRLLLKAGASPELRGWGLRRALHLAAAAGQVQCVTALLVGGARPEAQDALGDTALDLARVVGNVRCGLVLLPP